MEMLLSSVIFKIVMVPLHRGRYTYIHVFLWTQVFSLRGKFIPKITIFGDFAGCKPTFFKPQWWNSDWKCGPGTFSSMPKFV